MTPTLPARFHAELESRSGSALLITRNNLELHEQMKIAGPGLHWSRLTKDDLRGWKWHDLLRFLWSRSWSLVVVEDTPIDMSRRRDLYRGLLLSARAGSRWMLSGAGGEPFDAEPVRPVRDWPRLLGSVLLEAGATIRALIGAGALERRLRNAPRPGPSGSRTNPRVAVLRTAFWFNTKAGGSVTHALGVLGGMKSLGLEPRLWTTAPMPDDSLVQTVVAPAPRPSFIEEVAVAAFNRTFLRKTAEAIRQFDPGVVYHRHDAFSLIGLALARGLGIPLVLEVNGSEVWAREAWSRLHFGRLARAMERTAFARADRLVLISEELIPIVEELGGVRDRMVVSPNGVEVERFRPEDPGREIRSALGLPEDAVLCGFLGTFTRWHGVMFLAEQVGDLVAANPNLHFYFIGDGDLRPMVAETLADPRTASHVHFTGLLGPDVIPAHLAACDILLSPHLPFEDGSVFFGSPTKLFEYMASGRAIVASRLGQIARVVVPGVTGRLHDPGNGEQFREAVLALAADPEERRRLGREARRAAEDRYTWRENVRRALDGIVSFPDGQTG